MKTINLLPRHKNRKDFLVATCIYLAVILLSVFTITAESSPDNNGDIVTVLVVCTVIYGTFLFSHFKTAPALKDRGRRQKGWVYLLLTWFISAVLFTIVQVFIQPPDPGYHPTLPDAFANSLGISFIVHLLIAAFQGYLLARQYSKLRISELQPAHQVVAKDVLRLLLIAFVNLVVLAIAEAEGVIFVGMIAVIFFLIAFYTFDFLRLIP
jgi:hypothetical protein